MHRHSGQWMGSGGLSAGSPGSRRSQRSTSSGSKTTTERIQRGNAGMILSHMIRLLKRCGRQISAASCLGTAGLILATSPSLTAAEDALVTNIGRFQIPFDVEAEPGQPVAGFAVLFGSQDGGAHWEQLQSVSASQKAFMFSAPRDGRYSFAIRITDAQGNLQTAIQGSPPELEVVVDTVAPDLKLDLFESSPGQVLVNWTSTDSSVAPESLAIEYADGADGRWKPVEFRPATSGQALITASTGSVISVRAAMNDTAGNRVESSSQIVGRPAASVPVNGPLPLNPQRPPIPLGPTPFGGVPAPTSGGVSSGTAFSGNPAGTAFPSNVVANYPQMNQAGSFHGSSGMPGSATETTPAFPLQDSLSHSAAAYQMAGDVQMVSNQVFDLDYQIEDVGPSGVSAVELFVTENGGQQWFRYGHDADLKSPFSVDSQGEGTFGFAVRVRNGLGFADNPPQPGQAPEIVVTVDQTAPMIEIAQPSVRSDGFGTIQLAWRINEQFPTPTPIRLEHATTTNGPWTPVFDWQVDQGSHQWAVRPGTPSLLYFRLLARDAAGNVASAQPAQPVIVDLKKPVGRLLRVQAASHSTTQAYQP